MMGQRLSKGIAVGAGGHVLLGGPAQAGTKDEVHAQPLCQRFQRRSAVARDHARIVDLVEPDDVADGRL